MSLTGIGRDIAEMRTEVRSGVQRLTQMARRVTPGPALVRAGVYLSGLVALGLGWPTGFVLGRGLPVVAAFALLPALFPRGVLPTLVILAGAAGWLAATTVYDEPLTYLRLVVVATALYLVHTLAALAAALPYDAVVSAGVLGRWALRAGLVVVLTAAVALFAVEVPLVLGAGRSLIASIAGLGLIIGLAAYLASLVRRR
jgi:hypothetical protein